MLIGSETNLEDKWTLFTLNSVLNLKPQQFSIH